MDAYVLPRCPSKWNKRELELEAFSRLDEWQASCAYKLVSVQGYSTSLLDRINQALKSISEKWSGIDCKVVAAWAEILATTSLQLGQVELAQTHGDFQPGNILVSKASQEVTIIDWEYCAPRYALYDRFVYGLHSRPVQQMYQYCLRWLSCARFLPGLECQPLDRDWRLASLSMFLLEDLLWYLEHSTAQGYQTLSMGLSAFLRELACFGPYLEQLR